LPGEALRGGIVNASKTHCPRGHAYDEANTFRDRKGSRVCRECRKARPA
jgi:hypothetical protein